MAEAALDFYIDADDAYVPAQLPQGVVKMGGKEYPVRCPKDSLPMLLGRIEDQATKIKDASAYEGVIRQLAAAVFTKEDTEEILERVVDPYEPQVSVTFLISTVRKVYEAYSPYLDAAYEELGLQNPVKQEEGPKQPQDRKPSSKKPGAKKAAPRKAAAKKTAAPAARG